MQTLFCAQQQATNQNERVYDVKKLSNQMKR